METQQQKGNSHTLRRSKRIKQLPASPITQISYTRRRKNKKMVNSPPEQSTADGIIGDKENETVELNLGEEDVEEKAEEEQETDEEEQETDEETDEEEEEEDGKEEDEETDEEEGCTGRRNWQVKKIEDEMNISSDSDRLYINEVKAESDIPNHIEKSTNSDQILIDKGNDDNGIANVIILEEEFQLGKAVANEPQNDDREHVNDQPSSGTRIVKSYVSDTEQLVEVGDRQSKRKLETTVYSSDYKRLRMEVYQEMLKRNLKFDDNDVKMCMDITLKSAKYINFKEFMKANNNNRPICSLCKTMDVIKSEHCMKSHYLDYHSVINVTYRCYVRHCKHIFAPSGSSMKLHVVRHMRNYHDVLIPSDIDMLNCSLSIE